MNHIKNIAINWLQPLFAIALLLGCESRPGVTTPNDVTTPEVTWTSPANASTQVVLNTKIAATFSEAMDPTTLNTLSFILTNGNTIVSGTVSYTGLTATYDPDSDLLPNTTYTATITTAAQSQAEKSMASNTTWSFTTGSDLALLAPTVHLTDPTNTATDIPLNQKISATFSTAMDSKSISGTSFSVKAGTTIVSGAVTYTGTTAIFTPNTALASNTLYTATIAKSAMDLAGNTMEADYSWSFTTGTSVVITPPMVSSTDPATAATDIALNQKIAATFSKTMDASTITTASFQLARGTTLIPGFVTYSGTTAIFAPTSNLLPNTQYTATITTTAKDLTGNALANAYSWSFTTGASAVITPPVVSVTDPLNNATGVILSKRITATFSKTMNALTLTTATFTVKRGTIAVEGLVSYTGQTATFIPSGNLLPNTVYSASISTGAQDLASNSLAAKYDWSFTTGAAIVIVAPVVSYTSPAANANDIQIPTSVSVVFSKPMDTLTLTTSSFTLKNGATNIVGSVSYVGDTVKFTPSTPLSPSTTYTAKISTSAKDLVGTPLANDYSWNFTTLSIVAAKLNNAASFGGFGGSAGITNQGINTVIYGDMGTTGACTLVTGFHDMTGEVFTETPLNVGSVTGLINCAPPAPGTATKLAKAQSALADATIAYNYFAGLPGGPDPGAGELGGLVLAPGTYTASGGTFGITTGDLTLDAQNDPNALWVFQMASTLTVGQAGIPRNITLINGAQAKNVVWQVGSAATINGTGGGTMVGTIISYSGVTFSTAGNAMLTTLNGRAISLNASVTVVNTVINMP